MFFFNKKDTRIIKFNELTSQLFHATDISQLGYLAIEYALNNLDFDRLGLALYDAKLDRLHGTWGTDKNGILRNEEHLTKELRPELREKMDAKKHKGLIEIQHNVKLYDGDTCVGKGWNASIVIFHKQDCLGWIFADNLLNQKPFTEELSQSLKLFGAIVGQILVMIKAQTDIRNINLDLENKNNFLAKTMEKLSYAQDQIIESEKMSSLGRLVSSVSKELTGPIEYCIDASDEFKAITDEMYKKHKEGLSNEQVMDIYYQQVATSFNKILNSQKKAFKLLEQFQTITTNQMDDSIKEVDIDFIIPPMIENIKQICKADQHEFILFCRTQTKAKLQMSLLTQVFHQLILNSLQQGFTGSDIGTIKISISTNRDNTKLLIEYTDNRKDDFNYSFKKYDPFEKNNNKEYGLGKFIIYNLIVKKMNGFIETTQPKKGGLQYKIKLPITPI